LCFNDLVVGCVGTGVSFQLLFPVMSIGPGRCWSARKPGHARLSVGACRLDSGVLPLAALAEPRGVCFMSVIPIRLPGPGPLAHSNIFVPNPSCPCNAILLKIYDS